MGAVLHHPQDHGRQSRHVRAYAATSRRSKSPRKWRAGPQTTPARSAMSTCSACSAPNTAAWAKFFRTSMRSLASNIISKVAQRLDHQQFFEPLAGHRDELKGLHANTHIPQVIAAARIYELTGDRRYRDIAEYFWDEVVSERSYCTGGTSNQRIGMRYRSRKTCRRARHQLHRRLLRL